jgi:phage replication initiation protein
MSSHPEIGAPGAGGGARKDGPGAAAEPLLGAGQPGAPSPPRSVIRGESTTVPPSTHPYAAITDYLTVTFPFPLGSKGIGPFFSGLCQSIGIGLGNLAERRGGLLGFKHSYAFDRHGALFAFGGQNGRAMLSLPGEACAIVADWAALVAFLRDTLSGRITRWDGAVDDFNGTRTVDDAVRWYLADEFNAGGNRPGCRQDGNWLTPDTKGRTFYVGRRKNGKLMRVYEKGKQLGDPLSPWVRFELELHNKDREIPFDVLLRPGHYVAGSFPCMSWVHEEAFRIRTIQNQRHISYGAAVHWARVGLGQLVNTMAEVEGNADAVLGKLRRPGTPARLDLPEVPDGEGLRK